MPPQTLLSFSTRPGTHALRPFYPALDDIPVNAQLNCSSSLSPTWNRFSISRREGSIPESSAILRRKFGIVVVADLPSAGGIRWDDVDVAVHRGSHKAIPTSTAGKAGRGTDVERNEGAFKARNFQYSSSVPTHLERYAILCPVLCQYQRLLDVLLHIRFSQTKHQWGRWY